MLKPQGYKKNNFTITLPAYTEVKGNNILNT